MARARRPIPRQAASAALALVGVLGVSGVFAIAAGVTSPEVAPPTAARSLSKATLSLDSEPGGAEVWLDARLIGTTPLRRAEVPVGTRRVRIISPTRLAAIRDVDLRRGEETDLGRVTLRPWPVVNVSSLPAGAAVYVGGRRLARREGVPPTATSVEVRRPGFEPQEVAVDARPGTSVRLSLSAWTATTDTGSAEDLIPAEEPIQEPIEETEKSSLSRMIVTGCGHSASRASRVSYFSDDLALEWLRRHQSPNGAWDCERFAERCKSTTCSGAGEAAFTPGVSGLAMLAFLGSGETHQSGPYKEVVRRGLRYLKSIQDSEGCFGPRTSRRYQYNHACAALAMTEAYGNTGSRLFKGSAQRGVNFVHATQQPYLGWRYGANDGEADTSVTARMVMVLKSAQMAGLEIDPPTFQGAVRSIDEATDWHSGAVGYRAYGKGPNRWREHGDDFPADASEATTAAGILTRIFAGQDPTRNEAIRRGGDRIAQNLPTWDPEAGTVDVEYWYFGTLAMFQMGKPYWRPWNERLKSDAIAAQRIDRDRCDIGSWDPVGPWGGAGGRVYSTATMYSCMQVYYRYGRVFGTR